MTDRVLIPPIIPDELIDSCRVVALSDVGRVREENQDFMGFVSREDQQLLIVADGMGGHSGGFEASRIAVGELGTAFLDSAKDADPAQTLLDGVTRANAAVRKGAQDNPMLRGMGSTITAALVVDGKAWLAHVGDSRIYLIRDGKTLLLSQDHSRIFHMIEAGMITPDQAENHPMGHILERSIGSSDTVRVEVRDEPVSLRKGDVLLLCSDGLWSLVTEDEMTELFSEGDLKEAAEKAIVMALQRGADDNTTLAVLRKEEGPESGPVVADVREAMYAKARANEAVRTAEAQARQAAREAMSTEIPAISHTPAVSQGEPQSGNWSWLRIGVIAGLLLFVGAVIYVSIDFLGSRDASSSMKETSSDDEPAESSSPEAAEDAETVEEEPDSLSIIASEGDTKGGGKRSAADADEASSLDDSAVGDLGFQGGGGKDLEEEPGLMTGSAPGGSSVPEDIPPVDNVKNDVAIEKSRTGKSGLNSSDKKDEYRKKKGPKKIPDEPSPDELRQQQEVQQQNFILVNEQSNIGEEIMLEAVEEAPVQQQSSEEVDPEEDPQQLDPTAD